MNEFFESESQIRQDFPITKKIIYMNNGAIAPTPVSTIKAVTDFMLKCAVEGPDSAETQRYITSIIGELRSRVSHLINCDKEEIILVQSTTEGLNLVANGIDWKKGDTIVARGGRHEHFSNYLPWLSVANRTGAEIKELAIDENGLFAISDLDRAAKGARLITLSHVLYNTGTLMPLEEVGKIARENDALFCIDAAQSAGSIEIDVKKIGCDFMAFPGFKWLVGPLGIGVLYCRKSASDLLNPSVVSGDSALLTEQNQIAFLETPVKFQAGYRNYPGAAGLEASIRYILRIGVQNIRKKNMSVANALREEIGRLPSIKLYGPDDPKQRSSIVSFSSSSLAASEIVRIMAESNIVIAARDIGKTGKVVRAAPHFFNSEEEAMSIVRLVKSIAT